MNPDQSGFLKKNPYPNNYALRHRAIQPTLATTLSPPIPRAPILCHSVVESLFGHQTTRILAVVQVREGY